MKRVSCSERVPADRVKGGLGRNVFSNCRQENPGNVGKYPETSAKSCDLQKSRKSRVKIPQYLRKFCKHPRFFPGAPWATERRTPRWWLLDITPRWCGAVSDELSTAHSSSSSSRRSVCTAARWAGCTRCAIGCIRTTGSERAKSCMSEGEGKNLAFRRKCREKVGKNLRKICKILQKSRAEE